MPMLTLHTLDILGASLAFLTTCFYIKASPWAWPIGVLATINDAVLYALTGIYGDMALQGLYFVSMLYGWFVWTQGGNNKTALPVGHISSRVALYLMLLSVLGVALVSQVLSYYTTSQVPYLDAITMVLSLVAQWMMCRKWIESWVVWLFVDAIYVGLYCYKGIPFHAGLNLVYLLMAVSGYGYWRRLLREQGKDLTVAS